jgi:uncharacterized membrane protein YcaP (DUF421 family)
MDSKLLNDMFHLGLPLLEKILRPVIVYVFLIVALRLAGKRELAQLNPFDLVVLLMLSNTVQNAIIGEDTSVIGGLIGATTLLAVNYLVARFLNRHATMQRVVEGSTDILIEKGEMLRDMMEKVAISEADLEAAARRQGVAALEDVERAVLEPSGSISIIKRKPESEDSLHDELLRRLDRISRELSELRARQA